MLDALQIAAATYLAGWCPADAGLGSAPRTADNLDVFGRRGVGHAVASPVVGVQFRSVRAAVVIPRPRKVVWAELAAGDHPAWAGPADEHLQRSFGRPLEVGSATVTGPFPGPPFGLQSVWWTSVTAVVPQWSVTTETCAAVFEHTEMLLFEDHPDGTYARIEGSLRVANTEEGADQMAGLMTQLARQYLQRPAGWRPGDEARPVLLRPPGF